MAQVSVLQVRLVNLAFLEHERVGLMEVISSFKQGVVHLRYVVALEVRHHFHHVWLVLFRDFHLLHFHHKLFLLLILSLLFDVGLAQDLGLLLLAGLYFLLLLSRWLNRSLYLHRLVPVLPLSAVLKPRQLLFAWLYAIEVEFVCLWHRHFLGLQVNLLVVVRFDQVMVVLASID